jgi:hypothetical protein
MVKTLAYDLNEVVILFREHRILELRGLGNRLIREAALENNYGKAELGVIAYSLHKMETKPHFVQSPKWNAVRDAITHGMESAYTAAKQDNQKDFMEHLKGVVRNIDGIDSELGNYAQSIYDKAKVKQASLAYSYGLSIPQAADLTGADKKELQSYIGFTTMHDEEVEIKSIGERVDELRRIVGGEEPQNIK